MTVVPIAQSHVLDGPTANADIARILRVVLVPYPSNLLGVIPRQPRIGISVGQALAVTAAVFVEVMVYPPPLSSQVEGLEGSS